jgi:hypothetical protein
MVRFIPSSFGGGWAVPLDDDGFDILAAHFGDDAYPLAPLGGRLGYVVEPHGLDDLFQEVTLEVTLVA